MENKIDLEILRILKRNKKPMAFMEILKYVNFILKKDYGKGYVLRRCMKLEKIAMISTEKDGRFRMIKIRDLGRALLRVYK